MSLGKSGDVSVRQTKQTERLRTQEQKHAAKELLDAAGCCARGRAAQVLIVAASLKARIDFTFYFTFYCIPCLHHRQRCSLEYFREISKRERERERGIASGVFPANYCCRNEQRNTKIPSCFSPFYYDTTTQPFRRCKTSQLFHLLDGSTHAEIAESITCNLFRLSCICFIWAYLIDRLHLKTQLIMIKRLYCTTQNRGKREITDRKVYNLSLFHC